MTETENLAPVQEPSEEDVTRAFGAFMKAKRGERNLVLTDIATATGISHPHLSRLERGLRTPTLTTALKICDALGVSINDFVKEYKINP